MIDMHMHTKYSDGTDTCIEVLEKAENLKLDVISITDHNTCGAYEELANMDIKNYFNGRIVPGIELNTKVLNIPIEILGYNIDYKKMNELTKKIYITPEERNKIEFSRLCDKCKAYGIKLDEDVVEKFDCTGFASVHIHKNITKYEENKSKIDDESWENSRAFYRKYMSNPDTALYVEMDDLVPDYKTAVNLVKECGGLAFIPHIYEYRDNAEKILNFILDDNSLDGIECYYTTFSKEQNEYLLNVCKERNLLISGGSDYHGRNKPGVEIGVGNGNLKIPTKIFEKWKI